MEKSDFSPLPRQALYANKRQWNQFLSIFLLAAGIGFTVTGIIFFFAYNWDELPKFAKLGMVEVLLATSVLLAVFTRWSTLVKQVLLTGATFLTCFKLKSAVFVKFQSQDSSYILCVKNTHDLKFFLHMIRKCIEILIKIKFLLIGACAAESNVVLIHKLLFPSFEIIQNLYT